LRLSKQTEQFLRHRNPIRYLHFFTSLPCHLSIGSVITLVQSELSTPVDKYPRASAHQRACVRACVRGRSPVCMCYATNDGGGKETTQRKRKRKNGAIRIYDGITQSPLTHLTQGGLLGGDGLERQGSEPCATEGGVASITLTPREVSYVY
jgi:hypothetical protein